MRAVGFRRVELYLGWAEICWVLSCAGAGVGCSFPMTEVQQAFVKENTTNKCPTRPNVTLYKTRQHRDMPKGFRNNWSTYGISDQSYPRCGNLQLIERVWSRKAVLRIPVTVATPPTLRCRRCRCGGRCPMRPTREREHRFNDCTSHIVTQVLRELKRMLEFVLELNRPDLKFELGYRLEIRGQLNVGYVGETLRIRVKQIMLELEVVKS